jgi:hypothetical protein
VGKDFTFPFEVGKPDEMVSDSIEDIQICDT